MNKGSAIVWFTGVISKFNMMDSTLDNLQINNQLYNKLKEKYNLIFLIKIPDDEYLLQEPDTQTKLKYKEAFAKSNIKDDQVIYLPYSCDDSTVFDNLLQQFTNVVAYIDYSRRRLTIAAKYIPTDKVFHLSQLID